MTTKTIEPELFVISSYTDDHDDRPEIICAVYGQERVDEMVASLNEVVSSFDTFMRAIEHSSADICFWLDDDSKLSAKIRRALHKARVSVNKILTVNGYKKRHTHWQTFKGIRFYSDRVWVCK